MGHQGSWERLRSSMDLCTLLAGVLGSCEVICWEIGVTGGPGSSLALRTAGWCFWALQGGLPFNFLN